MEPKDEMEVPSFKRRLQGTSNVGTAAKVTRTVDVEQLQEFNGDGGGLQERLFAENVLHCVINLSQQDAAEQKKANKEKRKEGLNGTKGENKSIQDKIVKNACALLNSGGGILRMTISDSEGDISRNQLDMFWKTLEQKLNALVAPSTYNDVFDRFLRESAEVLLFVNAPQHLCTINYNLYFAGDAGVHGGTFDQVLDILQNSGNCPPRSSNDDLLGNLLVLLPKKLSFEKEFEDHESKKMQLKFFRGPKPILENHGQRDRVQKHISAFANSDGGVILVGIDDYGIVHGVDMKINTRANILKKVELMFKGMKFPVIPEKGVHWDLDFIKVSDCETTQDLAVPVIKVAGMKEFGGVFEKTPESYEIQNGKVQAIEYDEWKEKMKGSELTIITKVTELLLSNFEKLQCSSGDFHVLSVNSQVEKIRDSFFVAKEGFPVMPEGFQETLPKEVRDTIIVQIQKLSSRSTKERGLIVASKSWRASLGELPNDHVVCDLLVISNGLGGLHLYTVCREGMEDKCYDYSKEVSLNIKRKLVQNGGCSVRVYITYHVVSLSTKVEPPQSDKRYPHCYDLLNQKQGLNVVLKALVIILAQVPSMVSNNLGVNMKCLLTKEQFQLVHEEINRRRELWVSGAAETGKTLVALEVIKKIALTEKLKKDQILFVGEMEDIVQQERNANVCNAVTRETFMLNEFPDVRHLVMDDAHKFRFPDQEDIWTFDTTDPYQVHGFLAEPWYIKGKRVVRQHDAKNPGYLWIFMDERQRDHSCIWDVPLEPPQFHLKTVIRNSGQRRSSIKDEPLLGHDFDGENVSESTFLEYHVVEDVSVLSYTSSEESQSDVLTKTVRDLLDEGHWPQELAVLFFKSDVIPNNLSFDSCLIETAEENSSDKVVVSTIDEYIGSESPVVVLVDLECNVSLEDNLMSLQWSALTRATVKFVIIRCEKCKKMLDEQIERMVQL